MAKFITTNKETTIEISENRKVTNKNTYFCLKTILTQYAIYIKVK